MMIYPIRNLKCHYHWDDKNEGDHYLPVLHNASERVISMLNSSSGMFLKYCLMRKLPVLQSSRISTMYSFGVIFLPSSWGRGVSMSTRYQVSLRSLCSSTRQSYVPFSPVILMVNWSVFIVG